MNSVDIDRVPTSHPLADEPHRMLWKALMRQFIALVIRRDADTAGAANAAMYVDEKRGPDGATASYRSTSRTVTTRTRNDLTNFGQNLVRSVEQCESQGENSRVPAPA